MTATANTVRLQFKKPHAAQQQVLDCDVRFVVVVAGRRTGKTSFIPSKRLELILKGLPVAYFAPTYKMLSHYWREVKTLLAPITSHVSTQDHRLEFLTGGSYSMWSLDNPDAVRGQKYAAADIDEAAMIPDLEEAWNAVIRPTLTDYEGAAGFWSTPKGLNYFHLLFSRGQDVEFPEWESFRFPTSANPFINPKEIEAARKELPEDVFRQEYLAEFIQGEGAVFRNITANLIAEKDGYGKVLAIPEDHAGHKTVAGGDWGQVNDFTAVSVGCETCKRELELLRFNKIDWEFQRIQVLSLLDKWNVKTALFEENSIGSPNLEALQKASKRDIRGFMTTAQSKSPLIQSLALCLEQNEMQFLDIPIATRELEAYEARKSDVTGRITYNAPKGFHDDTVIARALMREAANQPVYSYPEYFSTTTRTY